MMIFNNMHFDPKILSSLLVGSQENSTGALASAGQKTRQEWKSSFDPEKGQSNQYIGDKAALLEKVKTIGKVLK